MRISGVTEARGYGWPPSTGVPGPGVKLWTCAFCGLLVLPAEGYCAAVCNGQPYCDDGCYWRHKLVQGPSVADIYEGRVAKAYAYRDARRADVVNHIRACCGHRNGSHDPPESRHAGRCHVDGCKCGRAKAIARSKETGDPGPILSCWLDLVDDLRDLLPWGLALACAGSLAWFGYQGAQDDARDRARAAAMPPPTPEEVVQAADTLVRAGLKGTR
jgi:hypothetical protein